MQARNLNRRTFLLSAGAGALFLLGGGLGTGARRSSPAGSGVERVNDSPAGDMHAEAFVPDAEISLTAVEKQVQILPGAQTRVWGYEGQLVSGSGVTVQAVPGSYLGPILRVQSGKKLRILFHNNLAERSVVHPHGLRVPVDSDGGPMQAIDPGQTKAYEFQIIDRASPAWFHPHPMGRTAEQVVMGLAGLLYVTDPDEAKAVPGANTGANDVPVIIQDRLFDANNQFLYRPHMLWGYLGDRILVNGQPDAVLNLEPHAYRLRFLNGSNARTYKLAWSNGMPLNVIGTDGGMLPSAVSKAYVMLMPGERLDVWADFAALAGQQVTLRSLDFQAGGMGMMGMGMGMMGSSSIGSMRGRMGATAGMGMMGSPRAGGMGMMMGSSLGNGVAFDVLTVKVGQKANTNPVLGALPALAAHFDATNVPNYAAPRQFTLSMRPMMTWTINGRVYEETAVADDEMVNRGETMAWEWINASPIPHPMHLHNAQFQVVQRTTDTAASSYGTVRDGLIDGGWKDTVLIWPGERVKIAMTFGPYTGMYMYHCHILEHEDMTMMRNYMIKEVQDTGM